MNTGAQRSVDWLISLAPYRRRSHSKPPWRVFAKVRVRPERESCYRPFQRDLWLGEGRRILSARSAFSAVSLVACPQRPCPFPCLCCLLRAPLYLAAHAIRDTLLHIYPHSPDHPCHSLHQHPFTPILNHSQLWQTSTRSLHLNALPSLLDICSPHRLRISKFSPLNDLPITKSDFFPPGHL